MTTTRSRSRITVQRLARAPHRAFLRGAGFSSAQAAAADGALIAARAETFG